MHSSELPEMMIMLKVGNVFIKGPQHEAHQKSNFFKPFPEQSLTYFNVV